MAPSSFRAARMRRGPRGVRFVALLLAACLLACRGPGEPQSKGGHDAQEAIGRMVAGGKPVKGTLVDGSEPPATDPYALAEPGSVQQGAPKPPSEPAARQDPYIRFGEHILVRQGPGAETYITKPYTMPATKAAKIVELMGALEPFPFRKRPDIDPATGQPAPTAPPLDPGILEYQVLPGWDLEFYSNLKVPPDGGAPVAPTATTLSDVMVVTASYGMLEQFEGFLDTFAAAGVPQIELEAKIIEVAETDQLDVGVKAGATFGSANFLQAFSFNLPNLASGTEAVLDLGAVQDSNVFDAVIQAIRTWDNVQIESQPKTVVRAGGIAYIESTTDFPYTEVKTISETGAFTAATVYKKVGVQLYISPRIIGTKMLALDVNLVGSEQVGSQTVFVSDKGQSIDVPVIANRTAKTLVYLEPGQTLLIGGLTTQHDREIVNKVPLLGDLPLIGLLFRSKFTRSEKQHVLFAISPRILQHSDFETEF